MLLAATTIITVLSFSASASGAATAVDVGWWTTLPLAVEPDVSDDSVLVRGGADPESPLAFAAFDFRLADGERPETLTLAVTPETATTPNATLQLCPLLETFTPVRGGTADRAPSYDCETSVESGPDDDGTEYRFDVAELTSAGGLAVAVLPTEVTDRVVLDAPDEAALTSSFEVAEPGSGDDPITPTSTVPAAGDADFTPGPAPSPDFRGPASCGDVDLPPPTTEAGDADRPTTDPSQDSSADIENAAAVPPPSGGDDTGPMAPIGFAVLATAGAVLWTRAGNSAVEEVDLAFSST